MTWGVLCPYSNSVIFVFLNACVYVSEYVYLAQVYLYVTHISQSLPQFVVGQFLYALLDIIDPLHAGLI